jgi:hypothetical protein
LLLALKTALAILLFISTSYASAQVRTRTWWEPATPSSVQVPDPFALTKEVNSILLGFEHTLALYNWGSNVRLNIGDEYVTTSLLVRADGLSRLRQETDSRTSEANTLIQPTFPIATGTTLLEAIMYGSVYNNDTKSGSALSGFANLSNVTDGYAAVGGRHIIDGSLTIQADGGIAIRNNNIGRSSGPILLSQVTLSPSKLDEDNVIESSLKLDERRFSYQDEIYRNDNVSATLRSNFSETGANLFRAGSSLKQRDFFYSLDSLTTVKQARNEILFDVYNEVRYPIVRDQLLSRLEVIVAPSIITRRTPGYDISSSASNSPFTSSLAPSNTSRSDFGLTAVLDLLPPDSSAKKGLSASLIVGYRERSENNTLEISEIGNSSSATIKSISDLLSASSFASDETSIIANTSYPTSLKGKFYAEFGSRIYRYDTPSEDNLDDRDELYSHGLLRYEHTFTSFFKASAGLRISQNHLVYLKSERSAQNNTINSIILSTSTEYRSDKVTNSLLGEVFANYTQYDFDLPSNVLSGTRDYVIRGMSLRDSFFVPFSLSSGVRSGIELRIDARLSEQGSFNANAFSSRPQLGTQEFIAEGLVHIVTGSDHFPVLARGGVKSLVISRSANLDATKTVGLILQEEIIRTGPVLYLTLDKAVTGGLRLYGYCWYGIVNSLRSGGIRTEYTQVEGRLITELQF